MKPAFRPIARRLLRSAAAAMCLLSLVICVVTCWLWLRSRGGDAYVASLTSPQRTYELRSRDGRLSVLRIEGRRPANPGSLLFSDSAVALVLVQQAPPPVVKSGFAGVEVERGPLNALEGAPTLVTSDASFTLLSSVGPQTLVNGNSPRLTLQGTNVVGGE